MQRHSMGDIRTAIKIENLSKRYRIGLRDELPDSFLQTGINYLKNPLKNFRRHKSLYTFDEKIDPNTGEVGNNAEIDVIWALRNITAEIKPGEVVGVIGRNGAGKSTLLKILSKIICPSSGFAEIKGRVSSLLEVGTGFHPELTGRENIFMNGTILGMKKKEIDRKFDQIVEFSGLEKFLDTPVKRYSSGMSVRLAFSVAAHLEPEILIIDEVLAVGDLDFQKKCLNKMDDVGKQGRTVLFVSHNLPAVTRLCNRAIWLEGGEIIRDGPCGSVIGEYIKKDNKSTAEMLYINNKSAPGGKNSKLRAVRILDENGKVSDTIDIRKEFSVEMEYDVLINGVKLLPHFGFVNAEGQTIFITVDHDPEWKTKTHETGHYTSKGFIPGNFLAEGLIYVNCSMITLNPVITEFHEQSVVSFMVVDSNEGDSARGEYAGPMPGIIRPLLQWKTEIVE
jgi:lipopolysaccharide transport system ATP-binding protein